MASHKGGKRLLTALILLAALGILACLAMVLSVFWMETHLPPEDGADVILVLGAQVREDGTPSVALSRRMETALAAYREARRPVICCGAQGANEPAPEGDVMRAWFVANGCPEEDIFAETASLNTRQNLSNARRIMEDIGATRALIVTSDYHVPRALALARQTGIPASGRGSPSKPQYFLYNHVREGLSWIKFLLESWRQS